MAEQEEKITMSRTEFETSLKVAATESSVQALTKAFGEHEKKEEAYLKEIFDKLRDVLDDMGKWPLRMNQCSSDLEHDILAHVKDNYMTKTDAELMEQHLSNNLKSIKLWIVASVGGFTSAGLLIAWALKLFS